MYLFKYFVGVNNATILAQVLGTLDPNCLSSSLGGIGAPRPSVSGFFPWYQGLLPAGTAPTPIWVPTLNSDARGLVVEFDGCLDTSMTIVVQTVVMMWCFSTVTQRLVIGAESLPVPVLADLDHVNQDNHVIHHQFICAQTVYGVAWPLG